MRDKNHNRLIVGTPRSYHHTISRVLKDSKNVAPRGVPTRELLNSSLYFREPRDRIIQDAARRVNLAFGVAEWVSLLGEIDDINFFTQFIGGYDQYSSDGKTLDGCYGTRVHGLEGVTAVIETLRRDPLSRRAVLPIYDLADLSGGGGKNTPCTLSLQFLIRDGKLDLYANMRSSDLIKGVTYDLFVFTLLQEYVAQHLGVKMGTYIHNAGSLHLYQSDLKMVSEMGLSKRWPHLMCPMPRVLVPDVALLIKLATLMDDDEQWFGVAHSTGWSSPEARLYLVNLAAVMKAFVDRRRAPVTSLQAYNLVRDMSLRHALRPWLKSVGVISHLEDLRDA